MHELKRKGVGLGKDHNEPLSWRSKQITRSKKEIKMWEEAVVVTCNSRFSLIEEQEHSIRPGLRNGVLGTKLFLQLFYGLSFQICHHFFVEWLGKGDIEVEKCLLHWHLYLVAVEFCRKIKLVLLLYFPCFNHNKNKYNWKLANPGNVMIIFTLLYAGVNVKTKFDRKSSNFRF